MDFLKSAVGQATDDQQQATGQQTMTTGEQSTSSSQGSGGFLDGLKNKVNSAAGGGVESEKNEDALDKGIDFVQEKFLGQGAQNNESAVEQAKDEQISDFLRGQFKSASGREFPVDDKPTTF